MDGGDQLGLVTCVVEIPLDVVIGLERVRHGSSPGYREEPFAQLLGWPSRRSTLAANDDAAGCPNQKGRRPGKWA